MNNVAIWAEGQNVVSGLSAQAGQIVQPTFQTQVADGQLSLRFTGSWFPGFRLDALTITPTSAPPPPLTDSAGGPYTGLEGVPVTLKATAAGGTGTYTYAWDLDGSGKYATAGQSVSHTFPDNGVYTVGLKVTDGAGTTATTTTTVNVANVAPTAQAGGPYTATAGQPLTLHGSVTDPGPADTAAGFTDTWNFGDGTPSVSGLNLTAPTHTYASAGTYTVTVTATDKDKATARPPPPP